MARIPSISSDRAVVPKSFKPDATRGPYRLRSYRSVTGAMVDLERTTHGLLVFLRFLPEFVGGMVLYSLYERGSPKWFGHDATFWLSIVALPLLEWLRAPNGLMLCALGLVLLTS